MLKAAAPRRVSLKVRAIKSLIRVDHKTTKAIELKPQRRPVPVAWGQLALPGNSQGTALPQAAEPAPLIILIVVVTQQGRKWECRKGDAVWCWQDTYWVECVYFQRYCLVSSWMCIFRVTALSAVQCVFSGLLPCQQFNVYFHSYCLVSRWMCAISVWLYYKPFNLITELLIRSNANLN